MHTFPLRRPSCYFYFYYALSPYCYTYSTYSPSRVGAARVGGLRREDWLGGRLRLRDRLGDRLRDRLRDRLSGRLVDRCESLSNASQHRPPQCVVILNPFSTPSGIAASTAVTAITTFTSFTAFTALNAATTAAVVECVEYGLVG